MAVQVICWLGAVAVWGAERGVLQVPLWPPHRVHGHGAHTPCHVTLAHLRLHPGSLQAYLTAAATSRPQSRRPRNTASPAATQQRQRSSGGMYIDSEGDSAHAMAVEAAAAAVRQQGAVDQAPWLTIDPQPPPFDQVVSVLSALQALVHSSADGHGGANDAHDRAAQTHASVLQARQLLRASGFNLVDMVLALAGVPFAACMHCLSLGDFMLGCLSQHESGDHITLSARAALHSPAWTLTYIL